MYLVALTGGIAAGKTTVADLWTTLGAVHVDADLLARAAVAKGSEGLMAVTDAFGAEIVTPDGELDRAKLASEIFVDAAKRAKLETIVHPIVRRLALAEIAEAPADSIVVYSIPLLAETGANHLDFDFVVTVEAPREKQIQRLIETRGLSKNEAEARIDAQARPAQRANLADAILNSNQDLALLLSDARKLWVQIEKSAQMKSRHPLDGGELDV